MSWAGLPLLATSVSTPWREMCRTTCSTALALIVGAHVTWSLRAAAAPLSAVDGRPGLHRVPVAEKMPTPFVGALSLGYGMTEAQPGERGAHHRTALISAFALAPLPELQLSLR